MISNTTVSSGGRNKTKGGGGTLRISTTYQPHLTSDEHRPKVKIWISFDHHHKNSGDRWTLTRKLYSPGNRQRQDFKQFFDIPLPSDKELAAFPLDAAVHFQVYAKMTDSHAGGNDPEENFEKDGSGKLYLAQLFAGNHGHATTKSIGVPLSLQSCIIENPKPVRKGRFVIRLEKQGTLLKRQLVFAAPSLSDVVPGNMKNLQGIIYTLIQRNLIIFDKKVMKAASVKFELTLPEGDRVHAPLWVNSTGLIIPGGYYFGNTSQHGTVWDEGFFSQILEISISRAGWTPERYTKTIEAQHGATATEKPAWSEYLTALRITWQSLTIVSNSIPYIADLAEGDDRRKKVVESFDDALSRNAGDCEDVAELIDRIYRGLRDGTNFTKSHVLAGQSVIRLYKACGALGTVTSRNIDEASGTYQGKPEVGSRRDLSGETGAHMTIVATPRVFFWEMLGRTTSDISKVMEHSEPAFVPRHPVTGKIVRQDWEKRLPVMIAEGTGGFRCTSRAEEAEFETRVEKKAAILRTLKLREAYSRLLTGLGPEQRNRMDRNELQMLAGFDGMQILRMQDALVNNPNVRLNTFFRLQTELFPCPERHEELFQAGADETGLGKQDPTSSGPSDPYSLRKIIPVQMGPRKGGGGISSLQKMTAGVNMVDIVNKQSFVGAIRLTKAHSLEIKAIQDSADHLPPEEELKLPSRQDAEKKQKIFRALSSAFGGSISRAGKLSGEDVLKNTTSVFVYWRLKKFGGVTQARQLGQSMRQNALVMEAELHLDHVAEGVATVRLQVRVVTSDMVKLNPKVVDKLLGPKVYSPEKKNTTTTTAAAAAAGQFSSKQTRSSIGANIPMTLSSDKKKPDPVKLSKFNMKEILRLSKTKTYGGSCLKDYLAKANQISNSSKTIGAGGLNGNGKDSSGLSKDISEFLGSIINFVIQGYQRLRWYTVIAIDNVFPDMTALKTWIYKLSSADTPVKTLKKLICEGYGNFLSLFDWALEAFPARSDEIIAAKLFKERVQQCTDLLDSIEDYAVLLLREVLSWIQPVIDFLSTLFNEALGYAGALIGKLSAAMTSEIQTRTVISSGVRQMAKQTTRLLFFGCSMVALAQQISSSIMGNRGLSDQVASKKGKKARSYIRSVVDSIGVRWGKYLSVWMVAFQRQLRKVAVFFGKVMDRVVSTSVWEAFGSAAQFMAEKFATAEDAVQTVVSWMVKMASRLKDRVLSFLNAMIAGGMETIMNAIGKFTEVIQFDKPPIPEDEFAYMEYTLSNANQIDPMKRAAFRAARDTVDDHLEKTRDEMFKSMQFTVLADVGDQISLRWEASGLVADSILGESILEDASAFQDLTTKLFGSGFSDPEKFSLPEESRVAYYRAMLDAMTEDLEPKHTKYVIETIRNFRYPSAWPGPKSNINMTTGVKIGSNGGGPTPTVTFPDDGGFGGKETEDEEEEEEAARKHMKKLKREAKKNAAVNFGLMLSELVGVSPLELQASDQKEFLNKAADQMEADLLLPKPGEKSIGRTVILNREAFLEWFDQKGRSLESITWTRIALEWILQNSDLLLFVRRGLTPTQDKQRVKVAALAAMAVFGPVFLLFAWQGITSYNAAQVQLQIKRTNWWDSFSQSKDHEIVDKLLGKKFDRTQDALSFRELLRENKNNLLNRVIGMNLEELKKDENLGWFEDTKFGKATSFSDAWTWTRSKIPWAASVEPSKVDNLLGKFENAVETIATKYVNNDEAIFGSLGDWIWARIRGLLLTLAGQTVPAAFLSSTAFGLPIGSLGLAAGVGSVLGYIAYHVASAYVIWSYTGDATAFQEAGNHAKWILFKVAHIVIPPLAASQLGRMFGTLSYLFSAWGMFGALILTYFVPQFGAIMTGLSGLAVTAVHQTVTTVSMANGDSLVLEPRLSALVQTRKAQQKAILDKIESVRLELSKILIKGSQKEVELQQQHRTLSLELKQQQEQSNNRLKFMILPMLMKMMASSGKGSQKQLLPSELKKMLGLTETQSPFAQPGDVGYAPNTEVLSIEWDDTEEMTTSSGLSSDDLRTDKIIHSSNVLRNRRPHGKAELVTLDEWLGDDEQDQVTIEDEDF